MTTFPVPTALRAAAATLCAAFAASVKLSTRMAGCALGILLLASCATRSAGAQIIAPALAPGAPAVLELSGTAFFSSREHQYAPAALATVLSASGVSTNLSQLTSLMYFPSKHVSSQTELGTLPARFSRLSYPIAPDLSVILAELQAHRPVLVRQNSGRSLLAKWHFAVVIGYDSSRDTLVLRSGPSRRQVMPASDFLRDWNNAERWAMLVLRPGELPAVANRDRYFAAAVQFSRSAPAADARLVFDAGLKRWPDYPAAWAGRAGVESKAGDVTAAARDYATAVRMDGSYASARDSLAMALLRMGCVHSAESELDRITESALPETLRTRVDGSREQVQSRAQQLTSGEPASCAQFTY